MSCVVEILGRGNAWPLELGAPACARASTLRHNPLEYSNTSFRVSGGLEGQEWNVVVDCGMGVIPALIQAGNRLPDALVLTHPHFDHIAGLDWLCASNARHGGGRRLPVYATAPCFAAVKHMFGWLERGIDFHPLPLGIAVELDTARGMRVTALPVFHGDYAAGACMPFVELVPNQPGEKPARLLFSGDLLVPLLPDKHLAFLAGADVVFVDANTRFPWPRSNHWSLTRGKFGQALVEWSRGDDIDSLLSPHAGDKSAGEFFAGFRKGRTDLFWTIEDFVGAIAPSNVCLVHYSGYEDREHHGEDILTDELLLDWCGSRCRQMGNWSMPKPGWRTNVVPGQAIVWK